MEMTYDAEADAVYLDFVEKVHDGEVSQSARLQTEPEINVDVDGQDRLLGFEILSASYVLRDEVLAKPRMI